MVCLYILPELYVILLVCYRWWQTDRMRTSPTNPTNRVNQTKNQIHSKRNKRRKIKTECRHIPLDNCVWTLCLMYGRPLIGVWTACDLDNWWGVWTACDLDTTFFIDHSQCHVLSRYRMWVWTGFIFINTIITDIVDTSYVPWSF